MWQDARCGPELLNQQDQDGNTPIQLAAVSNFTEAVRELASLPATEVNQQNEKNENKAALHHAMANNNPAMVEALLARPDTRLDLTGRNNETALLVACWSGADKVIPLYCADSRCTASLLNMKNAAGNTALMVAVLRGFLDCVQQLAQVEGLDWDTRNSDGHNLLSIARANKHRDLERYLMQSDKMKQQPIGDVDDLVAFITNDIPKKSKKVKKNKKRPSVSDFENIECAQNIEREHLKETEEHFQNTNKILESPTEAIATYENGWRNEVTEKSDDQISLVVKQKAKKDKKKKSQSTQNQQKNKIEEEDVNILQKNQNDPIIMDNNDTMKTSNEKSTKLNRRKRISIVQSQLNLKEARKETMVDSAIDGVDSNLADIRPDCAKDTDSNEFGGGADADKVGENKSSISDEIQKIQNEIEKTNKDFEEFIEAKGKEMSRIVEALNAKENIIDAKTKEIVKYEEQIAEIQSKIKSVRLESEKEEVVMKKYQVKKGRLEDYMDKEVIRFDRLKSDLVDKITDLQEDLKIKEEAKETIMDETKGERLGQKKATTKEDKMLRFLDRSIASKELELECPACLELPAAPVYMCPDSHLICSACRPRLVDCPLCRVRYPVSLARHRFAETALEELQELRHQRNLFSGELNLAGA